MSLFGKTFSGLCMWVFISLLIFSSCKENKGSQDAISSSDDSQQLREDIEGGGKNKKNVIVPSLRVDLENKGVGPIGVIVLGNIDNSLAEKGLQLFKLRCMACHKIDKKFIGPPVKGVLLRRSPEWIMNMILDPEKMVKKDPLARELMQEFNGAPMANQNLTEEEARSILEYIRTL